jgi:PAS domain S-box-containing protein
MKGRSSVADSEGFEARGTGLAATEEALRASEERLRLGAEVAEFGSYDLDVPTGEMVWSPEMYPIMGIAEGGPTDFESTIKLIHPDDLERVLSIFRDAIDPTGPGRAAAEFRIVRADGEVRWLLSRARTFFEGEGEDRRPVRYVGAVQDITERKRIEERVRESEARLRVVLSAGALGDWSWDAATDAVTLSEEAVALFGMSGKTGVSWADIRAVLHPDDAARAAAAVEASMAEGGDYRIDYRVLQPHGRMLWVHAVGRPIYDADGAAVGMVGAVQDVTARREAEEALREESRNLETLNRTGAAIAAELDLGRLVQIVTDAGVELTGAQFGAFFYNVIREGGERFLLYTLSGAERSDFESFGMPRATAVFHPTFMGEGIIRSDDITADVRYGKNDPHKGMPEGHLPVRSYLAVPVTSRSGEVIGGLFFGHPTVGRFTERHERLMIGIAAQAAIGIDNARLFQAAQREVADRVRAEAELRHLNETLEQRVAEEVARRAEAEEALRQAHKMETLGQLTGGVAHDFNNLLQIVTGNLEILQRNLPEDAGRLRRAAENAARGADRAAVLTQRLLAFSRRQPLAPKPVEPNKLLAGMSELLHRTLGETIEVETVLTPGLWKVEADPHQLENAILNLAVNARDAMPGGGKLTIETANTHLDRAYVAQNAEVTPGQYVVMCVSDTGAGMDEETVARAFEPFFTTKEVGKGTGLGLSMVYGFVKQSGGHLKIYSERGEGTTVKIYLPRLVGDAAVEEEQEEQFVPEGAREETILVCEDDDDVRAYSVEVLRELGYRVLEAHDGPSALRLLERPEGRVDLLFTDVVLPSGMTGAVLAEQARALRPDLKVLFTTGYARNAIVHHGRLDAGVELITKPFSYSELANRVRDLLDGG